MSELGKIVQKKSDSKLMNRFFNNYPNLMCRKAVTVNPLLTLSK